MIYDQKKIPLTLNYSLYSIQKKQSLEVRNSLNRFKPITKTWQDDFKWDLNKKCVDIRLCKILDLLKYLNYLKDYHEAERKIIYS